MSKIIDLAAKKNEMDIKIDELNKEIEELTIPDYEYVKNDIIEKLKTNNLVVNNPIEARMLSKILMDNDPNIHYCKMYSATSRKADFICIEPVMKTEESKDLMFIPNKYHLSYMNYLEDNNLLQCNDDGSIILID